MAGLIDPSKLRLATIECTSCHVVVSNPSRDEEYEFSRDHIHGNETLQAWFDARPPRK